MRRAYRAGTTVLYFSLVDGRGARDATPAYAVAFSRSPVPFDHSPFVRWAEDRPTNRPGIVTCEEPWPLLQLRTWRGVLARAAPRPPAVRPSGLLLMVAFAEIFPYPFFFWILNEKGGLHFLHTALVRSTSPENSRM